MGRLGSIHAENIARSSKAELTAVCDINADVLEKARKEYGSVGFSDLAKMLDHTIDAVVIASNTHLHIEHIKMAAAAGKHIFTEKPIGLTIKETDEALQAVVDAGVNFQIGFQRRWDPRFLAAKKAISDGAIGEPVLYKAYGRDPNASNPSNWGLDKNGGLFLNASIHDYDAMRFLMGKEVSKVSATGSALVYSGLKEFKDVDTSSTTAFLGDSAMAMTEWSRYAAYGYEIGLEIIGTAGKIQFSKDNSKSSSQLLIQTASEDGNTVIKEFGEAYKLEIDAFVKSILDGKPSTPGVEDARIALHIALAARESHDNHGKMIDVATSPALRPKRVTL